MGHHHEKILAIKWNDRAVLCSAIRRTSDRFVLRLVTPDQKTCRESRQRMKTAQRLRPFAVVLLVSIAIAAGVIWWTKHPRTTWYARDADSDRPLKVLFVGNSLTYYHDMPGLVAEMFRRRHPDQPLKIAMVTGPAFKLSDHLAYGEALKVIAHEGPWDWIILQESGRLANVHPEEVRQSLSTFATAARQAGARPVVFLDWHSSEEADAQSPLQKLASSLELPCVPIAEVWHRSRIVHPELELQRNDGIHPTAAGSYVIALVCYSYLSRNNPAGLPTRFQDPPNGFSFSVELNETVAGDLQSIAWDAVRSHQREQ